MGKQVDFIWTKYIDFFLIESDWMLKIKWPFIPIFLHLGACEVNFFYYKYESGFR